MLGHNNAVVAIYLQFSFNFRTDGPATSHGNVFRRSLPKTIPMVLDQLICLLQKYQNFGIALRRTIRCLLLRLKSPLVRPTRKRFNRFHYHSTFIKFGDYIYKIRNKRVVILCNNQARISV